MKQHRNPFWGTQLLTFTAAAVGSTAIIVSSGLLMALAVVTAMLAVAAAIQENRLLKMDTTYEPDEPMNQYTEH